MKKATQKMYARLIARKGVNVQKGQEVLIQAELDQPEFVKILVEECYKAGAAKVRVEWNYQPLTKLHVRYQHLRRLSKLEDWELEKLKQRAKTLPATIYLLSENPDGLRGMDQAKQAKAAQARYPLIKPISDSMENKYQWCIAAVPGVEWARKLFPGCTKGQAVEKLWKAILYTARADGADPLSDWDRHDAELARRCAYLNALQIDSLEYRAGNGTDFKVWLMPESQFLGGGEKTLGGVFYNPNMPTEEVFTTPMRGKAEGIVYASKPLSYRGEIIDGFSLRFEQGRVVEARAEKNEALLKTMLAMDEGASYLGECSFVPYDSPISHTNMLFFNTLFDENAACHLALGAGFSNCVRDFETLTLDECRQKGVNDSMIHEDFMIGTPDLDVVANTRDGRSVQIFRAGNWAFEI